MTVNRDAAGNIARGLSDDWALRCCSSSWRCRWAVLLPGLWGVAHAASSAAITATPTNVVPGQAFTVSGSGFGSGEPVALYWDNQLLAHVPTTDGAGNIAAITENIPASTASGSHTLLAEAGASSKVTSVVMTVPSASVQFSPSSGGPGTSVIISGSGFGASEPINVTVNGAQVAASTSTSTGAVSGIAFAFPSVTGQATVALVGTTSGRTASAPFTVTGQASVVIAPDSGGPGTVINIGGSGFGAGEAVVVTFDGAQVASGTTSGAGTLPTLSFSAPNPVAAGSHTVEVRGTASGRTASATFTVTSQATIALAPTTGDPGTTVVVNGSNFGASQPVVVTFDGAQVASGTSSSSGILPSMSFSVPDPAAAGSHTVEVRGTASGRTASAPFVVSGQTSIALAPTAGGPGTSVAVSGSGFGDSESVAVTFDGTQVAVGSSTNSGTVTGLPFAVPNPVAAGKHTVTLRGVATGRTVSTTFTVNSTPGITLAPTSGGPGTAVDVTGSGFGASEPITVSFDGTQVASSGTTSAGTLTGLAFSVPNPAAAGAHSVVVRGTTSGLTQSATFTVTSQATIALAPTTGGPGATVVINGSNFGASQPVTVSVDGLQVASGATSSVGAVANLSFKMPNPVAAGPHTVVVRGTASGRMASATFTIIGEPGIVLSPTNGVPGTTVAINGFGFGASQPVTVSLDGTQIAAISASSEGTLTNIRFIVPNPIAAGAHTIVVRGTASGRTASATFTAVPQAQLSLSLTAGAVGTVVHATGSGFAAGERVDFSVNGRGLGTGTTDGSGHLGTLALTIPALPGGAYTISARGETSGHTATVTFTITPTLIPGTKSIAAGSNLSLTGTGYAAHERVAISLGGISPATVNADATGAFHAALVPVPGSLPAGAYTLTARGLSSGHTATVGLSVSSAARLTLSRTTAIAGGLVIVSGQAFSRNARLAVFVDGTQVRTVTANIQGNFQAGIVLPSSLGAGTHTVSARAVASTGPQAHATLTIITAHARTTQTFHFVGTVLPRAGASLLHIDGILTVDIRTPDGRLHRTCASATRQWLDNRDAARLGAGQHNVVAPDHGWYPADRERLGGQFQSLRRHVRAE